MRGEGLFPPASTAGGQSELVGVSVCAVTEAGLVYNAPSWSDRKGLWLVV